MKNYEQKDYLPAKAARRLRKVEKLILEEPRRMNMAEWLLTDPGLIKLIARRRLRPPCGAVACIAGWVTQTSTAGRIAVSESGGWREVSIVAQEILEKEAGKEMDDRLFYAISWPSDLRLALRKETPGTRRYAKIVVQAIERFIKTGFRENGPRDQAPGE